MFSIKLSIKPLNGSTGTAVVPLRLHTVCFELDKLLFQSFYLLISPDGLLLAIISLLPHGFIVYLQGLHSFLESLTLFCSDLESCWDCRTGRHASRAGLPQTARRPRAQLLRSVVASTHKLVGSTDRKLACRVLGLNLLLVLVLLF